MRQARTLLADSTVKTIKAVYQSTKPPIRSVLVEGTTGAGEPWMGSVEYVETNGVYGLKERFPAVHKNLWVRLPQVDVVAEARESGRQARTVVKRLVNVSGMGRRESR